MRIALRGLKIPPEFLQIPCKIPAESQQNPGWAIPVAVHRRSLITGVPAGRAGGLGLCRMVQECGEAELALAQELAESEASKLELIRSVLWRCHTLLSPSLSFARARTQVRSGAPSKHARSHATT